MVTYVINTSENKTFDSDQLFRLVGYNKIQWLDCSLDKVEECVNFIMNKQGAIEAEEFRLAVLVDFFGFDLIRPPYGRKGYGNDEGVECSIYLPYIETYLKDRLLYVLEKQEYYAAECDVFYIKRGDFEVIENIDNLEEQVKKIVSPVKDTFCKDIKKYVLEDQTVYVNDSGKEYSEEDYLKLKKKIQDYDDALVEKISKKEREEIVEKQQKEIDILNNLTPMVKTVRTVKIEPTYSRFSLYCTKNLSLEFRIEDFPYGIDEDAEAISEREFFNAFYDRVGKGKAMRRHFYRTSLGGSTARAAFDNLSLSLHLIRLFEREDEIIEEGEMEVSGVDPEGLKQLLITAWNKIVCAQKISKENKSLYYALKTINEKTLTKSSTVKAETPEEAYKIERDKIVVKDSAIRKSVDLQYQEIMNMGKTNDGGYVDDDKKEFNRIISEYLVKRDEMSEMDVDIKFRELMRSDALEMTDQCPSKQDFDYVVGEKQDEISKLMGYTLQAEYTSTTFDKEKKDAEEHYQEYLAAKKVLTKNIGGDIIFLLLTVAVMIIPFIALKSIVGFTVGTVIGYVVSASVFAGLFILSLFLTIIPWIQKMKEIKAKMLECYKDCLAKRKVSLRQLKKRYQVELIDIEEFRYEIRQLTLLYEANLQKDKNVNKHRVVLEEVENCLSGILNNLGIRPTVDETETVEGEFDLMKPIRSSENKVYKIFSLEAIESLLLRKPTEDD